MKPNQQPNKKVFYSRANPRPGQDIVSPKRANQFPGVGMTLPAYHPPSEAAPASSSRPTPKPVVAGRRRKIIKRIILTLLLIGILIGGWLGGKFLYNAHKLFGGNILGVLSTTKLKGEDTGRVNILLAGNSADDVGHDGAELTDSIMLLSIDTKNHHAFMMSIPRDLWVDIGDSGHQKINAAYVVGKNNGFQANGLPNGGMGQLEQVVQDNLGININYYALVDYNAFKQAVDAVGGIDYTVHSSDPRGLYDPSIDYSTHGPLVKLTNGVHHLNGQQALDLARARGDAYRSYGFLQADFDRTQHQREMLVDLKTKAVTAGVLANPARLSSLLDAIGGNVKTDLTISEVRRLYDVTKDLGSTAIKSVSLNNVNGQNLLANYQAPNGSSALIPAAGLDDFSDIQTLLTQLMSSNPLVQEGASVVVLNGTDTSGLAAKASNLLKAKQLTVGATGDAKATQAVTTIIDTTAGAKPATKAALTQQFSGATVTSTNPYSGVYQADFIVVIGNDQVSKLTNSTN